jgi:hypothetical protein
MFMLSGVADLCPSSEERLVFEFDCSREEVESAWGGAKSCKCACGSGQLTAILQRDLTCWCWMLGVCGKSSKLNEGLMQVDEQEIARARNGIMATMRWEQPITCEQQYKLKDAVSVLVAKKDNRGNIGLAVNWAEEVTNRCPLKQVDVASV